MTYVCKTCGETYPYQPVICNECGVECTPETFRVEHEIQPTTEQIFVEEQEMFSNMTQYAEYCKVNPTITPQEWIKHHKIS